MTRWKAACAWIVVCAAGLGSAGCTNWGKNTGPKIDPTRAFIDAKTALRQAAEDRDVVTRRAAMEALGEVYGAEGGGLLKQALDDRDEGVRFAATMAVGDIRYAPALPTLRTKASEDRTRGEIDRRVYCADLYALYRLGDESQLGDLAALLCDRESEVRAVAAQVMGKVGNAAAIGLLKEALKNEMDERARYNMIEALAVLGDQGSVVKMESYARGYYVDLQLAAIPTISREYSPDTMAILRELTEDRFPSRVRVRAAGAMAKMGQGSEWGYDYCVDALRRPGKYATERETQDVVAAGVEVASLRQLAALSLGWMNRREALDVLHPLLQGPNGPVRVAAAMSIMRIIGAGPEISAPGPAAAASQPAAAETKAPAPPSPERPAGLKTSGAKD